MATETSMLTQAQQGDIEALSTLINQTLQIENAVIKVSFKEQDLHLKLESDSVLDQSATMLQLGRLFTELQIDSVQQIKVYAWITGEDFPAWHVEQIVSQIFTNSESDQNRADADVISEPTILQVENDEPETHKKRRGVRIGGMIGAVKNIATQNSGAIAKTVAGTAVSVGNAAIQSRQAASGTTNLLNNSTHQFAGSLGYVVELLQNSPQLQSLTKAVNLDWLLPILDKVDIVKAETAVKKLQKKYPNESPREIARRIMMEKVLYVGGSGMASSFVPGFAAAMFAVDLAATTAIQAEMGYQIAAAYGLDLHDPARKGEILAIFGLSFGSNYALKTGFGLLRNLPVAGAVVGASTNAVALYTVGYAACHFYESKVDASTSNGEAAAEAQAETEAFLKTAIAQQIIMDQILTHVVIAGQPESSWSAIAPELERLNFSPVSIQVIERQHAAPTPLEQLLAQVNQDFAIPLLAQCQKIAEADGIVTEKESAVIETITQTLTTSKAVAEQTESAKDTFESIKRSLFHFGRK